MDTARRGARRDWAWLRWASTTAVVVGAASLFPWLGIADSPRFPTHPVTFIVPYGVGGTVDVQLRALAAATEKFLGQPFVVENRPSSTGTLGPAQMAATARPDGYTVTDIHTGVLRLPFMTKTTYDPATDFTYIIRISGLVSGLVVRSDAPWKTLDEFLADAKAHPGKINYGAPSGGANPYIVMRQIAERRGIEWTHVPYKSFTESGAALLGGYIQAVSDAAGWAPFVSSGQFRLLATYGSARTRHWPDVPTLSDLGFDVVMNSAYGIAGPRGMDPTVVKILHDAFKHGMEEPSFASLLDKFEQEPMYQNTEDYGAYITSELATQKRLVEELDLKQE